MKILTVCGAGQGTSLLLKMNIQEIADELDLDVEVDNTSISTAKTANADLILAGEYHAENAEELEKPVITVEDFMDKEEIKHKLEEFLKKGE
ncbi:phosphotransferase system, galactitol-specific IIB component [Halobacteroides halobius DSM 5150]|uniref:Phosphotransferase system, galactitol-specific IIB component n=1 Tax=Halobacteroides halobius (strain ATCC 35273 / DSM 5150 / MD-1) TaxID=748449 RepID=L0K8S7_HALHC|nr:PTS sugar transporter subunit IIB [Halobacteroides halobius]AGB40759.1 phosphotransferase system, galactitol-specific IIB component [Halobacteroides halobius DSM 5150]